jgi:hypothetical protein
VSEPRIIGLLSWYEEDASWLAATIASLAKIGVDHLVAADGAYLLYPGGKGFSGPEQREAIEETVYGMGIALTLYIPRDPWIGNEVEKRSVLFALAEQCAIPNEDWYFVIDSDEVITAAPPDLRQQLAASEFDAGTAMVETREEPKSKQMRAFNWEPISRTPIPKFFRAIPGLRVRGAHYIYELPDGRRLWGAGEGGSSGFVSEYLDLTTVKLNHRTMFRGEHRKAQQKGYYDQREEHEIEAHLCHRCSDPATATVVTQIAIEDDGAISAYPVAVCEAHADEIDAESVKDMERLGIPLDYFQKNKPVGVNA